MISVSEFKVPEGWTTNVYEVGFGGPWEEQKWKGPLIAREYGLEDPRLRCTPHKRLASCEIIFRSRDRIFIWDKLGDTDCEITKPKDLDSILRTMVAKGERALREKRMWPMRRIDR